MSFNPHDTTQSIHLGNYEAFLLLYMDGELSPVQMDAVEAFLQEHPDLQGEFDLLLSTKLEGETVEMDKSILLSPAMQAHTAEEELLLYMDGELDEKKRKGVEQSILDNNVYAKQFAALSKAKLDAADVLPHPNKAALYRRSGRVVGMGYWLRIAAVLLVLASAVVFFLAGNREGVVPPAVAHGREKVPVEQQPPAPGITAPVDIDNEVKAVDNSGSIALKAIQKKPAEKERTPVTELPASLREEGLATQQMAALTRDDIPMVREKTVIATRIEASPVSKEIFNKGTVTNDLALRNTLYATPEAEATTEVASRKGSLKGFLRKATRLIERTTGIDATNSEDELLISAVAIKLK